MREKLETMLELVDAIEHFKMAIKHTNTTPYYDMFDRKYEQKHKVEIYNMCIERLKLRYNNLKTVI